MELFKLIGSIAVDTSSANEAIDETTKKAGDSGGKMSKVLTGIGNAGKKVGSMVAGTVKVAGGAAIAVGGAAVAAANSTREYRVEMGKLTTAFQTSGHSADSAKKTYSDLESILGDSGQAVEAANHLAVLTDNQKDLDTWTNICTGVFATFGDSLPIEGLTEAANETAKVGQVTGPLADALNWAGVSEDEFNKKLATCSTEQERQKLIMDVIHIFSNENGGILPYASTDNPMQDSDYILDKRNQSLFGSAEIAETYDFSSAETIENYLPLPNEPPDWKQDYTKYFQISDGSYKEIERNLQDVYVLQTVQPWNWNSNYKDYFYLSNGEYNNVESESKTTYVLLTKQPSDWAANYKDYFEVKENEYTAVDSVTVETYKKQTKQPNDWNKNYGNYYVTDGIDYSQCSADSKEVYNLQVRQPSDWKHTYKDTYCIYFNGKYVKCGDLAIYKKKAPKWRKNTFYNKGSKEVIPKWSAQDRYTKETKVVAPNWKANKYYMKVVTDFPTWTQNKYYTCQKDVDVGVEFAPNAYYEKVLDHYKTMVDGAIERFAEYYASDELEISLDTEKMYDIGDIVGAFENNTGIFVAQPITKKIVTIERDKESIRYEVKKNGS